MDYLRQKFVFALNFAWPKSAESDFSSQDFLDVPFQNAETLTGQLDFIGLVSRRCLLLPWIMLYALRLNAGRVTCSHVKSSKRAHAPNVCVV